mmetsp:Transcript_79794/g.243980  ORF Transcript_79794/g.243980 Transcript_79794/m.243980 type:complete len:635 (-) Transcript_79794:773-2677(-)
MIDCELEIQCIVDAAQDAEVPLEILDEAVPVGVRQVRLRRDRPAIRGQALLIDAVVPENFPILGHVAIGLQVLDDGPANANVLRRGVVVQLLMPLLVIRAVDLLDVVCVHDDKDLVSDLLPRVAAATHGGERPTDPHAAAQMRLPQLRHPGCDLVRGAREHPRLRARVPLPREQSLEGEPLPDEDPTPEPLLARLDVLLLGHLEEGHRRHAAPHGLAVVHVHEGVPRPHLPHGHALALLLPRIDEVQAVLVPSLQGHLLPRDLLLHNLVRHMGPLALPSADGRETGVGVAAAPGLEPLVARLILHHEADSCDRRLDDRVRTVIALFRGGRHRDVEALDVAAHVLQLDLARLRVHGLDARRPLHALLLQGRLPIAGARPLEGAEVQRALPQARVQPRPELHLQFRPLGVTRHVHVATIPLEVEHGPRHGGLRLPLLALAEEGAPALQRLLRLRLLARLRLALNPVPLFVPRELEAKVIVPILDPTIDRALVQHEHQVLVDLTRRDRHEGLVRAPREVRQRNALREFPRPVGACAAILHGHLRLGVREHVDNAFGLRCAGESDDLHASSAPLLDRRLAVLVDGFLDEFAEADRVRTLQPRCRLELLGRLGRWGLRHVHTGQLHSEVAATVLQPLIR